MRAVLEFDRPILAEVISTVGTEHITELDNMFVYPNPSSGEFNINLGGNYNHVSITIFNGVGQQIHSEGFTNTGLVSMNLNLAKGIYFVKISSTTTNGQLIKLIIN